MASPRPSPAALSAWKAMLAFMRSATTALDAQLGAEHDMTLDEYDVLYQLSTAPRGAGLRMTALAEALLVAPSSCTRVVGRLVAREWAERRPDSGDGRAVVVALMPAGRRALARASVTHLHGINDVFGAWVTDAEARALARMLGRPNLCDERHKNRCL